MPDPLGSVLSDLAAKLHGATDPTALYQAIASAPFEFPAEMAYIFLGFVTLMVANEATRQLELVSWSDTEHYHMAVANYPFDPSEYRVALDDPHNDFAKTVKCGKPLTPPSWTNVQRPAADDETTRLNQVSSGITHFTIYPLAGHRQGTLMFNFYDFDRDDVLKAAQLEFMERYTALVSAAIDKN